MIEFIHKYPGLIKIILTITTVAFVFGGYFIASDTSQLAAKVGGEVITMQEYQTTYYNLQDFYNKIYQGNMPRELMDQMDLEKMAIDNLIERKLALMAADDMDVRVGDDEVAEAVKNNPSFSGENGSFDKARYVDVLRYNNMTPQAFENSLREDLTIEKLRKIVSDSVEVTEDEIKAYYLDQMKLTGAQYDEQSYQENKDTYANNLASNKQAKTYKALIENLKKKYEIKMYNRFAEPAAS